MSELQPGRQEHELVTHFAIVKQLRSNSDGEYEILKEVILCQDQEVVFYPDGNYELFDIVVGHEGDLEEEKHTACIRMNAPFGEMMISPETYSRYYPMRHEKYPERTFLIPNNFDGDPPVFEIDWFCYRDHSTVLDTMWDNVFSNRGVYKPEEDPWKSQVIYQAS